MNFQILDAAGQQRDLHLGGTGVALVGRVLGDDLVLDVLAQRHRLLLCIRCAGHPGVSRMLTVRGRCTAFLQ